APPATTGPGSFPPPRQGVAWWLPRALRATFLAASPHHITSASNKVAGTLRVLSAVCGRHAERAFYGAKHLLLLLREVRQQPAEVAVAGEDDPLLVQREFRVERTQHLDAGEQVLGGKCFLDALVVGLDFLTQFLVLDHRQIRLRYGIGFRLQHLSDGVE